MPRARRRRKRGRKQTRRKMSKRKRSKRRVGIPPPRGSIRARNDVITPAREAHLLRRAPRAPPHARCPSNDRGASPQGLLGAVVQRALPTPPGTTAARPCRDLCGRGRTAPPANGTAGQGSAGGTYGQWARAGGGGGVAGGVLFGCH